MDNKKDSFSVNIEYTEAQTVPLALHEVHMARNDRRIKYLCIGWAASVILIVFAFVFLWLQYDYESVTEYSGVYNITDSEGNVITSDLTPEDVIRIMENLNGQSQEN